MRHSWANIALLILLVIQLASGLAGLISGTEDFAWVLWFHSAGAYALVVLLFWKGAIITGVFRRRPRMNASRIAFLLLALLLLAILGTGLIWTAVGPIAIAGFSFMTVHAVLALGLVALLAWHVLARRFVFRIPTARDRRSFLRLAGISLAGAGLWRVAQGSKAALGWPGASRRFTGSYEVARAPGDFPIVSWLFDAPPPLDGDAWRLTLRGAAAQPLSLTYAQLLDLATETWTVTLDCTGGWYSRQTWQGVRLDRLLALAGPMGSSQALTLEAVSGYKRRFSLAQASELLLATHVAGQALSHGHGFPARLVAPGYRGFNWVKWVVAITVDDLPAIWQPPLPLQ